MENMSKDKKIFFIIISLMLLLTLLGVTYSYFQSTVTNTSLSGSSCFDISYVKGQDIDAELTPGATYDSGHSTDVVMYAKESCDSVILGKLYITTNDISTMDLSDNALKYAVVVNGEVVSEGTINGTTNQLIYNNFTLNKTATTYKVYVWLDQALEDTSNLSEEVYSGFVHAEAIAKSTVLPLATNAIMALATDDACQAGGTGLCATNSYTDTDGTTKYHDYRFRGGEGVNNFVSFNNDLYRIIGIFDSNSHGVEGQYLIKLISANELSANSWGVYNSSATSGTYSNYANDWTGNTTGVKANLNILLNEYFYNKTNTSSTYGSCSNWTYYSNDTSKRTNDCTNIVGYGIDSSLRNYIENVTWYLKGYTSGDYSKQNFYLCERGLSTDTTNCMSGNSGAYDASTTGKIGLMYVSDYMYASGAYSDISTEFLSDEYYGGGKNNWLYNGYEWTITPEADSAYRVFYVGNFIYTIGNSYDGYGVRPTFYLKSNIYVTGGLGTFDNPYTISV